MNFRKLLTYLAVGTAAVIPFAGAQNPTILQGNYISNVFGQSNFILNPNAQTNVANVTVSSATVTRSTTTPLVATSEFNITTSTATGYADWATRTFDAGMKNQNCEARFTYRGFSVGSTTVQVRQGSNTVAQLTLTASTDPRIASINFPCGDLSSATTLRVQQATAALTGTNELSGLYLGLATNQANVAQAETVVIAPKTLNQTIADNTPTVITFSETLDVYNEFDGSVFTAKRAGNYLINAQIRSAFSSWALNQYFQIEVQKNNASEIIDYKMADATVSKSFFAAANKVVTLAVGDTIRVRSLILRGGANTDVIAGASDSFLTISRLPTSSELVVTPQAAAIKYASNTGGEGTAANTNYTSSAYFSSSENGSIMPNVTQSVAATATCYDASFGEEIKTTDIIEMQINHSSSIDRWTTLDTNFATVSSFQYNNTKWYGAYVIPKTASTGLIQICFANSGAYLLGAYGSATAGDYATWNSKYSSGQRYRVVKRPASASNSALYVQGPVLGAQTGAAISSGYVGELKQASSAGFIAAGATVTPKTYASLTLEPGVWSCATAVTYLCNALNCTDPVLGFSGTNNGSPGSIDGIQIGIWYQQNGWQYQSGGTIPQTIRSTGSSLIFPDGTTSGSNILYAVARVTYPSGSPQINGKANCTRLN